MEILYLLLGWLLGLISPLIGDRVRKRWLVRELASGLSTELSEIRFRLAVQVYSLSQSNGRFNRSVLEWCRSALSECGVGAIADRMRSGMDAQLKLSDQQIEQEGQRRRRQGLRSTILRAYRLPFLDSHIGSIGVLSASTQQLLMGIRSQIEFLNEQIAQTHHFEEKTFVFDLGSPNRTVVEENLRTLYESIEDRARDIAERIGDLEIKLPSVWRRN